MKQKKGCDNSRTASLGVAALSWGQAPCPAVGTAPRQQGAHFAPATRWDSLAGPALAAAGFWGVSQQGRPVPVGLGCHSAFQITTAGAPASQVSVGSSPGFSTSIQLPANVSGRAAGDGPKSCMELLAADSSLAACKLLWPRRWKARSHHISPFNHPPPQLLSLLSK